MQMFTQAIEKRGARSDIERVILAVNLEFNMTRIVARRCRRSGGFSCANYRLHIRFVVHIFLVSPRSIGEAPKEHVPGYSPIARTKRLARMYKCIGLGLLDATADHLWHHAICRGVFSGCFF